MAESFDNNDQKDFYLDTDDAQSFGNAEFMRRPQSVKKTFPKIAGGKALIPPTFAPKASFDTPKSSNSDSTQSSNTETPAATPTERRKADSNMDMFRNMAKNLKN